MLGTANGWPPTKERERKQAAVKVEFGFHVPREMDSRWDAVPIGCVQGLRWNGFTLERVYVGPRLRVYVGTLEAGDAFRVGRGYVKRVLRWDVGTFRPTLHCLTLFFHDRNWRNCGKYTRDNFSVARDNF